MRRAIIPALALLGLASPCLAADQGPPDFGIDTSGTLRNLSVRDATLGSRVPLAILDTTTHSFVTPTRPVELYGAKGDSNGTTGNGTDDTAAIEACVAGGHVCVLRPGATYRLMSTVDIPSGGGLVGDRSSTLYADPAGFTNTNGSAGTRYGANAVALSCRGLYVIPWTPLGTCTFRGLRLTMGITDGGSNRRVMAIEARNVTRLIADDNEIYSFPGGGGIITATLGGGSISGNHIHDMVDSAGVEFSAIELDNDVANGVGSRNVRVTNNTIDWIMTTAAGWTAASNAIQQNGIKIIGNSSTVANRPMFLAVNNNKISRTGQCIDSYSFRSSISGNVLDKCYYWGVSIKHSGSFNAISNNAISDSGNGIMVQSNNSTLSDFAEYNSVTGNNIDGVGADDWTGIAAATGRWASLGSDTACIITWQGPDQHPANTLIVGNHCKTTTSTAQQSRWAYVRGGTPAETNNWFDNQPATGVAGAIYNPNSEAGDFTAGSLFRSDGASATMPVKVQNGSGGEACVDLNPTTGAAGSRSSQVCGYTPSAGASGLRLKTANGGVPATRLEISQSGYVRIVTTRLVSELPACTAGLEGAAQGVADALAPAALATVAGGGAAHVRVYCNGTNWIVQ